MAYDYSELLEQARRWADQAATAGRLTRHQAQALHEIDSRSPDSLFDAGQGAVALRPLIVAFMGGTGVGKSSLLNRLAGQAIARAGVERPTSREVTLYHHQTLALQHLPAALPLDSIKICTHQNPAQANIVWMDMPDFDSIERGNQRQVLEWLPHIDVLIYVVSPERYRDNKAWQLLLAEGAKHAWLFVMNQWDRGLPVQFDDFKQQLQTAGFNQPLLFRTSCQTPDADDFADMQQQLQELSGQHGVSQLSRHSQRRRLLQLQTVLQEIAADLDDRDYGQLANAYQQLWQEYSASLEPGLLWPMRQLADYWSAHPGQKPDIKLWDDWAQSRFDDVLDGLAVQAAQLQLPVKPLKTGMQHLKNQADKKITHYTELAVRSALLNPGNAVQRFALRLASICETLLPLLAMAAVAYQVYLGYYQGLSNKAFLGVDFAVHSVLLIGLSWLIPFFIHKKIQPSLQKAALQGLQKGLQQATAALEADIKALLAAEQASQQAMQQELAQMINACTPPVEQKPDGGGLLDRVLLAELLK